MTNARYQRGLNSFSLLGRAAILVGGIAVGTGGLQGCAVTEGDVQRWSTTERGPEKLASVVRHTKYRPELRVSAADALIRVKPRSGKRIGIDGLLSTLAELSDTERAVVTNGLIPLLVEEMGKDRPQKNADGTWPQDPSVPFKDAAFGLISHEPSLVGGEDGMKQKLEAALALWVQTDFENRVDISSQLFGIEQVARFLGPQAVNQLPKLLDARSTKLDRISTLIADIASAETKAAASTRLVEIARSIDSNGWLEKSGGEDVKKANAKSGYKPDAASYAKQLEMYRDQEMEKLFSAMKKVGGHDAALFAAGFAADATKPANRRKAALASLEGHGSELHAAESEKIFNVAKDDSTPDDVRDLAFARLGELKKTDVEKKLYSLFDNKRWKIRWVSAQVLLRSLDPAQIETFLSHLPPSAATTMGMSEAFTYGDLIRKLEPKGSSAASAVKPIDVLKAHMAPGPASGMGARLTAIGAFYEGRKTDIGLVKPFEGDPTPISKCKDEDECGWVCDFPPDDPKSQPKVIGTIGDFVTFCVIPSMRSN